MADKKELNYQNFPYIYEQYLGGNFEKFMRGIAEIKKKHIQTAMDTAFNDCFNLKTAKGNALDMWGRLLNISRFIPAEFNFDDETEHPINEYQTLSDDDFRTILIWAYQSQNFTITIDNLKEWLNGYFNMGAIIQDKNAVNVTDFQNMSERILYSENVADFLKWVLTEYDLIPRPAGVLDSLIPIYNKVIGFKVSDDTNFLNYRTNFFFGRFANENDIKPLPYERVEYLQTGLNGANNPFIDTGLNLNSDYEFYVKGFIPSGSFGSLVTGFFSTDDRAGQIIYNAGNRRISYFWHFNEIGQTLATFDLNNSVIDLSQPFELSQNKNGFTISQNSNSERVTYTAPNAKETNQTILLFRNNNGATIANNMASAICEAKIILNGEVLRHFIPVIRKNDNKYCFYDLIEGRFYENANSAGIDFIV